MFVQSIPIREMLKFFINFCSEGESHFDFRAFSRSRRWRLRMLRRTGFTGRQSPNEPSLHAQFSLKTQTSTSASAGGTQAGDRATQSFLSSRCNPKPSSAQRGLSRPLWKRPWLCTVLGKGSWKYQ